MPLAIVLAPLDMGVVGLFIVAILALGFSARLRENSVLQFLAAGRALTLPAFVATLVSTWYGGILGICESVSYYGVGTWLLMGVPSVTLLGTTITGRASASFQTVLGLERLVAQTPEAYLEIARREAADLPGLARERATLRERLLASPLGDTRRYTRAVEEVYRRLWRRWCEANV